MIQFAADPALTTLSTSWFVWELFAGHLLTHTLPATADFDPLYYVAGRNAETGGHVFKAAVYNSTDGADVPVALRFDGLRPGAKAELTLLTGPENVYEHNAPGGPNVVRTTTEKLVADDAGVFNFALPDMSVAVLDTAPFVRPCKPKDSMKHGARK